MLPAGVLPKPVPHAGHDLTSDPQLRMIAATEHTSSHELERDPYVVDRGHRKAAVASGVPRLDLRMVSRNHSRMMMPAEMEAWGRVRMGAHHTAFVAPLVEEAALEGTRLVAYAACSAVPDPEVTQGYITSAADGPQSTPDSQKTKTQDSVQKQVLG